MTLTIAGESAGFEYFRLEAAPSLIGRLEGQGRSLSWQSEHRRGPLILNLRRLDNGTGRPRMGSRPARVVPFPHGTLSLADLLRVRESTSTCLSEHSYV